MLSLTRSVAAVLLVLYVVFLGAVLTEYNPTVARDVVADVETWLQAQGAPAATTGPGRVEFLLNAAMFAPIAFLAGITFPRHPWANWVVYGFMGSAAVELVQGLYLPPRSAQFVDVVANTLGAVLGALASLVVSTCIRDRPAATSPGAGDGRPA